MPEAVFNALCRDTYSKGGADYSVTEILNPPQLVQLKRRYEDEIESDVMDNVWSLLGKAAHHILESHAPEASLSEERLAIDVLGRKLSGQTDNYHDGIITDYKITSAFTLVYGSRLAEWEEQLNIYAYIFRKHGYVVERLQIVAILRDWSEMKAKADWNYPQTPIKIIPLNVWHEDDQIHFIERRIAEQISNEERSDEMLEPCSATSMWEQPSKFAVMKEGRKTAVRVFDTQEEADAALCGYSDREDRWPYSVVKRPGTRTRCERYCPVASKCFQFKKFKEDSIE